VGHEEEGLRGIGAGGIFLQETSKLGCRKLVETIPVKLAGELEIVPGPSRVEVRQKEE